MKVNRLAILAVVLLFSLVFISVGQANDETKQTGNFVPRMQGASQQTSAPGAPATDTAAQLTPEQLADLMMAGKEFREAAIAYKKLFDQFPTSAVISNKLGIALHKEA